MSKQEFSRLDVLLRVQSGRLRISDACVLIGLCQPADDFEASHTGLAQARMEVLTRSFGFTASRLTSRFQGGSGEVELVRV
jgi:hypothetical protein